MEEAEILRGHASPVLIANRVSNAVVVVVVTAAVTVAANATRRARCYAGSHAMRNEGLGDAG